MLNGLIYIRPPFRIPRCGRTSLARPGRDPNVNLNRLTGPTGNGHSVSLSLVTPRTHGVLHILS